MLSQTEQFLLYMKGETRATRQLRTLQAKHLRAWIAGAVPDAVSYGDIAVDFDGWEVRFTVEVPADSWPRPNLLQGLARSVWWLLGEGYAVVVGSKEWTYREEAKDPSQRSREPLVKPKPSTSSRKPKGS